MKENTRYTAGFIAALLIIFLFAGCASQEKQGSEEITPTTLITDQQGSSSTEKVTTTAASATTTRKATTTPDTTTPLNKALNESCAIDADCASKCCAYNGTKHKCADAEACKPPKKATEEECYAKQMNWCAGNCQRGACENCTTYARCVVSTDSGKREVMVEIAGKSQSKEGSCNFSGETEKAAGENGFCGTHKGEMIYAKCGSQPEAKDCAAAYGNPLGYTYRILSQRAFHSPEGADYDLWCFMCERAG